MDELWQERERVENEQETETKSDELYLVPILFY
jgi:hypothetical protein